MKIPLRACNACATVKEVAQSYIKTLKGVTEMEQQTAVQKFNAIKVDIRSVLIAMILSAGVGVHFAGSPATQTLVPAAAVSAPATTAVERVGG